MILCDILAKSKGEICIKLVCTHMPNCTMDTILCRLETGYEIFEIRYCNSCIFDI